MLTRRGRLVLFALVVGLLLALALTVGPSTAASDASSDPVDMSKVRVKPGETVWEIASESNPGGDIRRTVDRIMKLNSLPDAGSLQGGEVIAVPVYR